MIDPTLWSRIILVCPDCHSWQLDFGFLTPLDEVVDPILLDHLASCPGE